MGVLGLVPRALAGTLGRTQVPEGRAPVVHCALMTGLCVGQDKQLAHSAKAMKPFREYVSMKSPGRRVCAVHSVKYDIVCTVRSLV